MSTLLTFHRVQVHYVRCGGAFLQGATQPNSTQPPTRLNSTQLNSQLDSQLDSGDRQLSTGCTSS